MKKVFLIAFFAVFTFSSSSFAFGNDNYSQSSTEKTSKYNLGIQLKFMSGIGLSGDFYINERNFLTGSASWLFSITDVSFGSGYKVSRLFDLVGKLNFISVSSGSNEGLLVFPEISTRLKLSNLFFFDAGMIIPFSSENRKILNDYLNVPFIINVGVIFNFFSSQ